MKRGIWIVIGVLFLAFLVAATVTVGQHLFRTRPTVARKAGQPIPVRVTTAKQATLVETLGANGEVQPIALIDLTATLSERVEKVTVDLGDMVAPGQELMRFDRALLNAALTTAQSTLELATGERERALQYFQRIKAIYEQGLLPHIEVEKARAVMEETNARFSEAQEKLLRAKKTLQNTSVTAPVSSIVMQRLINPGETPQVSQKLFIIGRIDHVLVETKIAEERVGDVHLGQSATVTFNAFPHDVVEGEIVKIKPVIASETRTFFVYVKVPNPRLKLKPGLTGFVRIKRELRGLVVPSVALLQPTGVQESAVFLVDTEVIARLRKVKVGVVAEGMTEILGGLAAGDQVVVIGQFNLRDGDQVRIGDEFHDMGPKVAKERPRKGTAAIARLLGLQAWKDKP